MSDGPHRSLPMRRHWKDLAERAAKAAFSPDQVCEALPLALKCDILEAPIEAMSVHAAGLTEASDVYICKDMSAPSLRETTWMSSDPTLLSENGLGLTND
jgi:hypothetical protein